MRRVAYRVVAISVLALGLSVSGSSLGLTGSVGAGLIQMTFLNSRLEFLASQSGAPFSPLRLAWEAQVEAWPFPWVGLGAGWLTSSGQVHGRDPQVQTVTAWGLGIGLRVPRLLPGWPVALRAGGRVAWASLSGPVEAGGLGWDLAASVEWRFLELGPIGAAISLTGRYFPIPTVWDPRGTPVDTRGLPAANFSGLYLGLALTWR